MALGCQRLIPPIQVPIQAGRATFALERYALDVLFMVVEIFKRGASPVGERFADRGRMLPDDVAYLGSWVEVGGDRCFQLVDAPARESLGAWIDVWSDLIDFEVLPVETSADFWKR